MSPNSDFRDEFSERPLTKYTGQWARKSPQAGVGRSASLASVVVWKEAEVQIVRLSPASRPALCRTKSDEVAIAASGSVLRLELSSPLDAPTWKLPSLGRTV